MNCYTCAMPKRKSLPIAMTIAGSDSGGGAGIQADLKTFAALGVHGTSAVTCFTAQNPRGVRSIQPASASMVQKQMEAVFAELRPGAVKTGMLFSAEIVRAVAKFFRDLEGRRPPLIVDPVMVATSGAQLLEPMALETLVEELFPLASLLMPNRAEAEVLLGRKIRTKTELRTAADELQRHFGCAVLVKGGHVRGGRWAVDYFSDRKDILRLAGRFVRGVSTHGTGCTFSAAVAGYCALGNVLPVAVSLAKGYITGAIAGSGVAGGHAVLNHFWSE